MSNSVLEDTQRASDYKESNQSSKTVSIKFSSVTTRTSIRAAMKSVESDASKSQSLTRVSTRRFTGSHVVEIGDLQAADFTGMDSSAVISAWGLCRPSIDFLAAYLDIHGKSSADIFDFAPADSSFFQRVSDFNSLIEESYLGANKTEIESVTNQQRPSDCDRNAFSAFSVETLTNNSGTEKVNSCGKEVTTSRTIDLRITHTSSLSRKVLQ